MNGSHVLDAISVRGARVGAWLAERRAEHADAHNAQHGRVDPVRVEAEFYDALYGERSGTVENIASLGVGSKSNSATGRTARAARRD